MDGAGQELSDSGFGLLKVSGLGSRRLGLHPFLVSV